MDLRESLMLSMRFHDDLQSIALGCLLTEQIVDCALEERRVEHFAACIICRERYKMATALIAIEQGDPREPEIGSPFFVIGTD